MKFRVTGTNHTTGARMTLEFEAGSKAAAEKKAQGAGMDVQHSQVVSEGESPADQPHASRRGEHSGGGMGGIIKLAIVLSIIAAVAYFAWPMIRGMLRR